MNCRQVETLLIGYLDGRARAAEHREVEAHLKACAACRARAEEFHRLRGVLDQLPAIEPSPSFDARLRARIAAEPRPHRWAWLIPSPRPALALALLIALAVWISSRPPGMIGNEPLTARSEEEFKMIKELPVLEDYDVLASFEALSELPPAHAAEKRQI